VLFRSPELLVEIEAVAVKPLNAAQHPA
jgi:hypothetical protein